MTESASVFQTLWPLPGGAEAYMESLIVVLDLANKAVDTEAAIESVVGHFPNVTSKKTAYSYLRVAVMLGLIDMDGPSCEVSADGKRLLKKSDKALVLGLLKSRIAGVDDLLDLIQQKPRRIGLLHDAMQSQGYSWSGQSQIRYRLRWLEAVGAIHREGKGRPLYRLGSALH